MKVYLTLFCALALLELSQGKTRLSYPELYHDEAKELDPEAHPVGYADEPSTKEFLANLLDVLELAQGIMPKYQPGKFDEQQEEAILNFDNFKVFKTNSANAPKFSIWG